ncbi:CsbD family protein [Aeromicrobium ginsengisoli]|uniref:CsbD family protein n=1 Tax=Aeromicrobium ginsengisoli TaxID=363867 RepID=A0A5M4FCI4_9ACTN|nr:CsbD family protein [Aeromicrobium ginsengisoli]KAA1396005.1 CsbD family protein [Aeromicrobium ginsengisoli]
MGLDDKLSNAAEDAKGKAKEAVGSATGDDELERQGKGDQAKSDLKDAAENVKDAFKH